MPVSTMLVIAAIVGMFSIFAIALAWADRTRDSATLTVAKASGQSRRRPA